MLILCERVSTLRHARQLGLRAEDVLCAIGARDPRPLQPADAVDAPGRRAEAGQRIARGRRVPGAEGAGGCGWRGDHAVELRRGVRSRSASLSLSPTSVTLSLSASPLSLRPFCGAACTICRHVCRRVCMPVRARYVGVCVGVRACLCPHPRVPRAATDHLCGAACTMCESCHTHVLAPPKRK